MLTQLQEAWLHDLETTTAKQGINHLHKGDRFCCLGRACVVAVEHGVTVDVQVTAVYGDPNEYLTSYDDAASALPDSVTDALHLRSRYGDPFNSSNFPILSARNDNGSTFKEIAAIIRANPEQYFKSEDA